MNTNEHIPELKALWVCEYSPDQNAFHVNTMDRILDSNQFMMQNRKFSGFIPIGVFRTPEEAHKAAERYGLNRRERAINKSQQTVKNKLICPLLAASRGNPRLSLCNGAACAWYDIVANECVISNLSELESLAVYRLSD